MGWGAVWSTADGVQQLIDGGGRAALGVLLAPSMDWCDRGHPFQVVCAMLGVSRTSELWQKMARINGNGKKEGGPASWDCVVRSVGSLCRLFGSATIWDKLEESNALSLDVSACMPVVMECRRLRDALHAPGVDDTTRIATLKCVRDFRNAVSHSTLQLHEYSDAPLQACVMVMEWLSVPTAVMDDARRVLQSWGVLEVIPPWELLVSRTISEGSFGVVPLARWRRGHDVALKVNREGGADAGALQREMVLLERLARKPHDHVVKVFGLCYDVALSDGCSVGVGVVMEYCECGTLKQFLVEKVGDARCCRCCSWL